MAMSPPQLHFELAEYRARIAATRRAMAERGIELLIVSDPSNMAWLTGYDGWSFYVHQCVLLARSFPHGSGWRCAWARRVHARVRWQA
jgi:ectoine hydrolase